MNRPLFGFRPNLQNERHRRAWEILQAVPDGQKNAFLVQAILESEEKETFETTLRRVLREELQAVPSQPVKQPEEAIPQEMMGFLGSLLEEDYPTKNGTKSVVFYNQGMRRNGRVVVTENPDIIGRANENRRYTSLTDRLEGHVCEFCGAETEDIEIHHVRKLKDLSGKAEWERQMIARKRKTIALCHSCHVKLHNGKLD